MVLSLCMCLFFLNFLPSSFPLSVAALNLRCYAQSLWLWRARATFHYSAQASRCGAQALGTQASVVAARGHQQSMVLLNQGQQLDFSQAGCLLPDHTPPRSAASGACRHGSLLHSAHLIPPARRSVISAPRKRETCCWEMSLHQGVSGEETSPAFTIHYGPQIRESQKLSVGPPSFHLQSPTALFPSHRLETL